MSAKQNNCSLHEIPQTPCGSSRDKESHVFLSECNTDISAHLLSCHLPKCGDVTEAELIMARVGIRGMSATQLTHVTICPRHRHSLGRFWRVPNSCQYPGHTGCYKLVNYSRKSLNLFIDPSKKYPTLFNHTPRKYICK